MVIHRGDAPQGYVRGDDGKFYPHRIVAGITTIAIAGSNDPEAAERAARIERAMAQAVTDALAEGIAIDSPEIKARMLRARDRSLSQIDHVEQLVATAVNDAIKEGVTAEQLAERIKAIRDKARRDDP